MHNDIHNIFESYIKINEIAFPHGEYDEPDPQGNEDILLSLLKQLQNSPGPLYNVPADTIEKLVNEYSNTSTNEILNQINSMYVEADLILLEFNRNNKNLYILLNFEDQYVYPHVFTNFQQALDYSGKIYRQITGNIENDDNAGDLPKPPRF